MVMMVLAPSTALFKEGSRVSGVGPYWTVKPAVLTLPVEEPAAEEAEPEVAVEPALLPPQAASMDAALIAAIAFTNCLREIFIFVLLQSPYSVG